ncbi:hypothetical protein [Fodinibius halophilus]|uniref:Uncharacterized protein n=1 Tax=Fodinibius halophilus TaxID=1736908 RepID=A0A6M1T3N6_9BACT|nr:hypothetical protein [Fodinibius halophilus]NGP87825.1 hypothetical protein [Fodinibius halophilus]
MNFGLITSYVVGGIILIGILSMTLSVSNNSTEMTLTSVTREKASGIVEIIEHDIQKIGYNRTEKTDPIIVAADSNLIQFRSNIDNSTDNSVELVTWHFTTTSITSSKNPNDYILMRSVKNLSTGTIENTPIKLGVTNFNIKYLDEYGEPVSNHMSTPVTGSDLEEIRQLYIQLIVESKSKVYKFNKDDGRYVTSIWEKRFSPGNLESN